jgi:AcrR family transcriptional regulator
MRSSVDLPQAFYLSPDDPPAKRTILQAALRRLVRDRLCETSIRAIAADAGYANPALFKHFASKEALALYLLEQCHRRYAAAIGAAIRLGGPFAANARAVLERFAALYFVAAARDDPRPVLPA